MQIKPVMSCREEVPEPDSFFLGSGRCELMFEISSVIKSDSVPYAAVRAEATSGVQAEPRPSSSVQNGGAHHRVMLGLRAIVDVTFCQSARRRQDRLQIREPIDDNGERCDQLLALFGQVGRKQILGSRRNGDETIFRL
jgi:hypothetical protein